jgi:alpha-L-fucosidase 2
MFLQRLFFLFLLTTASGLIALAQPTQPLVWHFPITRPHTGILLGNGTQGLMVWGEGRTLKITVARAGFWDHRGGNEFSARTTYQDVKRLLQAGDYKGIRAAFAVPRTGDQGFGHPQQLGGGRLEITLPEGWTLKRGELDMGKGEIRISAALQNQSHTIFIRQAFNQELTWVDFPPVLTFQDGWGWHTKARVNIISASKNIEEQLKRVGVESANTWISSDALNIGFSQRLPTDSSLYISCVGVDKGTIIISSALSDQTDKNTIKARERTGHAVSAFMDDRKSSTLATANFWRDYWASVPRISLPDPALQEIVDYGLYKQACVTPPQGVAATLQGPFMEDYQVVPWSNDYHFNINVEMMYWPALATNRLSHFGPLWTMMKGWMPTLQKNGESFFGRKGALMLPHAVDDRCHVVGTFWTGTIDHACTAWMAQMAWQHYRYGLDQPDAKQVLSDMAWPLLVGAFEGYYAMLEEVSDSSYANGKRYSLPISVSPEYGGDGENAWGRDASFQLAALHRICRILPEAARAMGLPVDPRWADVDKRLPAYSLVKGVFMTEWNIANERIGLWQGKDLDGSHRHHSHLAGIYPFATIDLNDPAQRKIVDNSLAAWRFRGSGGWSGWCVPWASILMARTGQPEAAVSWLHFWKDNFTNEGRGTLHNANNNGTSFLGAPDWTKEKQNREVMQLDGGFGALNAVLELLVQSRDDGIYVLPGLPRTWRELSFDRIRTEGAFQIGATVSEGRLTEIRVKSLAGGPLRLVHGLGETFAVNGQKTTGKVFEKTCTKGETLVLKPL